MTRRLAIPAGALALAFLFVQGALTAGAVTAGAPAQELPPAGGGE